MTVLFLLLAGALLYWLIGRLGSDARKQKVEAALREMAQSDPVWSEEALLADVRTTFFAVERAWCALDLDALRTLLHPQLYRQWEPGLRDRLRTGTRDRMDGLTLLDAWIVAAQNRPGKGDDSFAACIKAQAVDYTVDAGGHVVTGNTGNAAPAAETFTEIWTFQRLGDTWQVLEISQEGELGRFLAAPVIDER